MPTSLVSTGVQFPDSTIQTTAVIGAGKSANTQTFNSSGTWTKPSGYGSSARVLIQCWGGGGGGADLIGGNVGGGGGGGAYNERWINLSSMGSTETATVGAGGTRGTSAPGGGAGGNTSLGTLVYAYGGGGGSGSNCTSEQVGGGGGGQLSAGSRGVVGQSGTYSGKPWFVTVPRDSSGAAAGYNQLSDVPSSVQGNRSLAGKMYDSFWHGGGGGSRNVNTTGGFGSNSVFGGGGGGAWDQTGGSSQQGGAGGNSPGGAATAPAGGGAGGSNVSSVASAGAAGRIIVTVFDGA